MTSIPRRPAPRSLAALLCFAATLLPLPAFGQASVNARLTSGLGSCGGPPDAVPAGTPTSMAVVVAHSYGGCTMRASAYAYLGVTGANARVGWNTGDWSSGGISALSSGTWSDRLRPRIAPSYLANGVRFLDLTFSLSATGAVSASASGDPNAGGGSASIAYDYNIGGAAGNGSQTRNSDGVYTEAGTWGTITRTVRLNAVQFTNGEYGFDLFGFTMSGIANAGVGKLYQPLAIAINEAHADFGSTLVWLGILNVAAFDFSGNAVTLGADANFSLVGEQTGFDYRNSAIAAPTTTVPEPGTVLLLAPALAGLLMLARRRRASR